MAVASGNISSTQTPSGSPDFVKLAEGLKCPICHDVLRDAMQTTCGHRICDKDVRVMFEGLQEQESVPCPAKEEDCLSQKRNDLNSHMDNCPNKPKECKFKSVGCMFNGTEQQVTKHILNDLNSHLELIKVYTGNMDLQSMEMRRQMQEVTTERDQLRQMVAAQEQELIVIRAQQEKIDKANKELKMKMVSMTERIIHLERRSEDMAKKEVVDKHDRDAPAFETTLTRVRTQAATIERRGLTGGNRGTAGNNFTELNRRVDLHDNQFAQLDVQMAELDLRFQILETASYDGTFLWKLRDYSRWKQDAVSGKTLSLYSQPFYTHRFGYKMCDRCQGFIWRLTGFTVETIISLYGTKYLLLVMYDVPLVWNPLHQVDLWILWVTIETIFNDGTEQVPSFGAQMHEVCFCVCFQGYHSGSEMNTFHAACSQNGRDTEAQADGNYPVEQNIGLNEACKVNIPTHSIDNTSQEKATEISVSEEKTVETKDLSLEGAVMKTEKYHKRLENKNLKDRPVFEEMDSSFEQTNKDSERSIGTEKTVTKLLNICFMVTLWFCVLQAQPAFGAAVPRQLHPLLQSSDPLCQPLAKCEVSGMYIDLREICFRERIHSGSHYECVDDKDYGPMEFVSPDEDDCPKGKRKVAIYLSSIGSVFLRLEDCPEGYFQDHPTQCLKACKTKHPYRRHHVVLYSEPNAISPGSGYCDWENGWFNLDNITIFSLSRQKACVHRGEHSSKCREDKDILPNSTCVFPCVAGSDRDPHNEFLCTLRVSSNINLPGNIPAQPGQTAGSTTPSFQTTAKSLSDKDQLGVKDEKTEGNAVWKVVGPVIGIAGILLGIASCLVCLVCRLKQESQNRRGGSYQPAPSSETGTEGSPESLPSSGNGNDEKSPIINNISSKTTQNGGTILQIKSSKDLNISINNYYNDGKKDGDESELESDNGNEVPDVPGQQEIDTNNEIKNVPIQPVFPQQRRPSPPNDERNNDELAHNDHNMLELKEGDATSQTYRKELAD